MRGAWIYNERIKGISIAATDEGHRKNNSIEGEDEGQGKRGTREGAGSAAETRGVRMAHTKGDVADSSSEDKGGGEKGEGSGKRIRGHVRRAPGATTVPRFTRRLSREIHRQRDLLRDLSL